MADKKQMTKHSISVRPRQRKNNEKKNRRKSEQHRPPSAIVMRKPINEFCSKITSFFLFDLRRQITTMSAHQNGCFIHFTFEAVCSTLLWIEHANGCIECDTLTISLWHLAFSTQKRNMSSNQNERNIISNTNRIYIWLHKRNENCRSISATKFQMKIDGCDDNNVCMWCDERVDVPASGRAGEQASEHTKKNRS